MSARPSVPLDRTLAVCLLVLGVFGALRLAGAVPEDFAAGEPTLAACYVTFVEPGVATYLYVPLFTFCALRSQRPLFFSAWAARSAGRAQALGACVRALALRALLFSVFVMAPSLAAVVLRSGQAFSPAYVAAFAVVQLLYETLFFMVAGLVFTAARLLTASALPAMLLAVVYGASDTLVSFLDVTHSGVLWTGWMVMGWGDPSNPSFALAGLARLSAFCVLLLLAARRAVSGIDLFEDGGALGGVE